MNCKVLAISVALILSTAGLVTIAQPRAASAGGETRAVGTLTTTFANPDIAQRTQGNLVMLSRYSVSTYGGSLHAATLALRTVISDDVVEEKAFQTDTCQLWGAWKDV